MAEETETTLEETTPAAVAPVRVAVTVKSVPPHLFTIALADHFKKSGKFELPDWHDLIKTAPFKEMPPMDPDWYYTRCASVARRVYLHGGLGVGGFSRVFGGRNRRGSKKPHWARASKGLIRHMLAALQEADIVAKRKKGRWITQNGQRELDIIAGQVAENRTGVNFFKAMAAAEEQQMKDRLALEESQLLEEEEEPTEMGEMGEMGEEITEI